MYVTSCLFLDTGLCALQIRRICDMIKGNESNVGNIDFDIKEVTNSYVLFFF